MDELKFIIAKNISNLRRSAGMTQLNLAEKLNYSDKAISKWERGESVPDLFVLKTIADNFGVTVDYLLTEDHSKEKPNKREFSSRNHIIITIISILLVWNIATVVYVVFSFATKIGFWSAVPFMVAVPVSFIVWLVFNSIWFNRKLNYLIISLLMWSVFLCAYLVLWGRIEGFWRIFFVGIPAQAIISAWSFIKRKKDK